jgi:hypothetical protein
MNLLLHIKVHNIDEISNKAQSTILSRETAHFRPHLRNLFQVQIKSFKDCKV